jgi:hypothetical protein
MISAMYNMSGCVVSDIQTRRREVVCQIQHRVTDANGPLIIQELLDAASF